MKFSIIIPVYNSARTIERCIISCLEQTYRNFEIILVDDGSTDNSLALINRFSGPIKIIELNENYGPSYARNSGWNNASGNFVLFLDSDDAFHPERLEVLAAIIQQQPEVLVLYNDYVVDKMLPIEQYNVVLTKRSFMKNLLVNKIATPCLCVAREIDIRYPENMRYCEDHYFLTQLSWQNEIFHLSLPLTILDHAVLTGDGLSSQFKKMRMGEMNMYWNIGRVHPALAIFAPFLILWSLAKSIRHFRLFFK